MESKTGEKEMFGKGTIFFFFGLWHSVRLATE
jgi:hypothetical protein